MQKRECNKNDFFGRNILLLLPKDGDQAVLGRDGLQYISIKDIDGKLIMHKKLEAKYKMLSNYYDARRDDEICHLLSFDSVHTIIKQVKNRYVLEFLLYERSFGDNVVKESRTVEDFKFETKDLSVDIIGLMQYFMNKDDNEAKYIISERYGIILASGNECRIRKNSFEEALQQDKELIAISILNGQCSAYKFSIYKEEKNSYLIRQKKYIIKKDDFDISSLSSHKEYKKIN